MHVLPWSAHDALRGWRRIFVQSGITLAAPRAISLAAPTAVSLAAPPRSVSPPRTRSLWPPRVRSHRPVCNGRRPGQRPTVARVGRGPGTPMGRSLPVPRCRGSRTHQQRGGAGLRSGVPSRRTTQGTRTDVGSTFVQRIMTAHANCKRQGRSVLTFLADTLVAHSQALTPPSLMPSGPQRTPVVQTGLNRYHRTWWLDRQGQDRRVRGVEGGVGADVARHVPDAPGHGRARSAPSSSSPTAEAGAV
jgi:hypothetical protein